MSNSHITVYEVVNAVTGDNYIGISKFSAKRRWTTHIYNAMIVGKRTWLYNAIRKYGPEAFTVTPIASVLSREYAWEVEREIIQARKPTYNLTNGGEWTEGRRVPPETVERIRQGSLGKRRTPEQKRHQSELKKALYAANPALREAATKTIRAARALVDEGKRKAAAQAAHASREQTEREKAAGMRNITEWRKDPEKVNGWRDKQSACRRKSIECVELATIFDSMLDCAEAMGIHFSNISRAARQGLRAGGYHFRYV